MQGVLIPIVLPGLQAGVGGDRGGAKTPKCGGLGDARRLSSGAAALAAVALAGAAIAQSPAGEAPFGLTWGPVAEVPRPSKVDREANLTALYYPRGWGPATEPATAQVVLVVCRDEGLQQVVWVSVPLSGKAFATARQTIRDEGIRRYGKPVPARTPDSEVWPVCSALLASREAADGGGRELVMVALGLGYAACFETHRAETGHPAGMHVADLIGTADH